MIKIGQIVCFNDYNENDSEDNIGIYDHVVEIGSERIYFNKGSNSSSWIYEYELLTSITDVFCDTL